MTRIYLDNAATTPISPEVLEAMMPFLTTNFGNPSSIHSDGRVSRMAIENGRKIIAKQLGASIGEIFFTSGGTESNNMAIKCAVRDLGVTRVITSPTEHHCVLHTVEHVEQMGQAKVEMVGLTPKGRPDLNHLEAKLAGSSEKTLVSIMHGNNETGLMVDLAALSALCQQYGAYLHTDTVQTMGHFNINVQQTPVSFLSGSAHKFHGPKGIGFIYINNNNQIHKRQQ